MSRLSWGPKYELGVPVIDEQHRRLMELMNALRDVEEGLSPEDAVISTVLSELFDYLEEHFSVEEHLMRANGYPDYLLHREEHSAFVLEVIAFDERFRAGEELLSSLHRFLESWLKEHILGSDRAFLPFLRTA